MLRCRHDQGNIKIAARKNGTFLLEGREENKETELLETSEMQRRGHRRWAHTHTAPADGVHRPSEGSASSLRSTLQGQGGRC